MAADGIVLMLTAIEALIGIARRPSSSTRFRFGPSPRKLKVAAPGVRWDPAKVLPASNCETAGTNFGSLFIPGLEATQGCSSKRGAATVPNWLFASHAPLTMRRT